MSKIRLSEQTVVMTGSHSGTVRAAARAFAQQGVAVVLAAHDPEPWRPETESIARLGGRAHVVAADAAHPGQLQRLAREAGDWFGRIDVWIHVVAAHAPMRGDEDALEARRGPGAPDRLLETAAVARAVVPILRSQGSGTLIIATPLPADFVSTPEDEAILAGLQKLTEAMNQELRRERSRAAAALVTVPEEHPEEALLRSAGYPVRRPGPSKPRIRPLAWSLAGLAAAAGVGFALRRRRGQGGPPEPRSLRP